MSIKSIALGGVAAFAFAGMAVAADLSASPSAPLQVAASDVKSDVSDALTMHKPLTKAEMKTAISVANVKDPSNTLKSADVRTTGDETIGEVHSVTTDDHGKISGVKLDIGGFLGMGEHTVALDPAKLSYVPSRNIIVTSFTKDELKALPEAKTN